MLKFSKLVGVINSIFTLVLISALVSFISNADTNSALALYFTSFAFIVIALVLTIPFVVFLKKKGFENNKFYILTHLCFSGSSLLSFVVSLLFQ